MAVKKSEDQFRVLLVETILAMCRNTLNYDSEVSVEGLIGITLDKEEIFLVTINQLISNPDAVSSTGKRKRKRKRKSKHQDSNSDDSDNQSGTEEESNKRSRPQSEQSDHSQRQEKSSGGGDKDNGKSGKPSSDKKGSRKNGDGNGDDLVFLKEEPGGGSGPHQSPTYSFPNVSEALSSSSQAANPLRTPPSSHTGDMGQRDNQYLSSPGTSRADPVAGTSQDRTYAGNRRRSRDSPRNHGNYTHSSLMNLQTMVHQHAGNRIPRHPAGNVEGYRAMPHNQIRPPNPMQRFVRPPGPGVQQFAHQPRYPNMSPDGGMNMGMDPRVGQLMHSPTSMGPPVAPPVGSSIGPPLGSPVMPGNSPNHGQTYGQRSPYGHQYPMMHSPQHSQGYNHMRSDMTPLISRQPHPAQVPSQGPRYPGMPYNSAQPPPLRNVLPQYPPNRGPPPLTMPSKMTTAVVPTAVPAGPRSPEPIVIGPQETQASDCLMAIANRMGPDSVSSQSNVPSTSNNSVTPTSSASHSANLRLSPHYINILDSLMSADLPGSSPNPNSAQPQPCAKYICPVCSLDCLYLHELWKHVLIHNSQEPHGPLVCPIGCPQQNVASLMEYHGHLVSHLTNSTNVCSKCNVRFPFAHELDRHKAVCIPVSSESPVSQLLSNLYVPYCNDCKQTYPTKDELNKHLVDAHGSTLDEILCEMCNKTFEGSLRLRWHLQDDHNISLVEYRRRLESGNFNVLDDDDLEILDVQNPRKRKNDP